MPYSMIRYGAPNYVDKYYEYVCDTPEDVADLPAEPTLVAPGSVAYVASDSSKYRLNCQKVWVKEIK